MNDHMEKRVNLSCALVFLFLSVSGQVYIGNEDNPPETSAMLEVSSTGKGLLVPGMPETARTAIPSPALGLFVYQNNSTSGHYFFDGTAWKRFSIFNSSTVLNGSVLFAQSNAISSVPTQLFWDISNNRLGIGTATPGQKLSVNGYAETTSQGLKFPDGSSQAKASRGCLITFAANNNENNDYLRPFGDVDEADPASSGIQTVYPIPLTGRIVAVAWRSEAADATTTYWVHYGATYTTFTLTGQNGLITALSLNVSAGDNIEINHSSGTKPDRIIMTFYLNE
jgi:hypothetical protein